MLDEEVVIAPCFVDGGVVSKTGVGSSRGDRVLRDWDPAEAVLVTTRALLEDGNPHVDPCIPRHIMVAPEEGRVAGVNRSGARVDSQVPGVAML